MTVTSSEDPSPRPTPLNDGPQTKSCRASARADQLKTRSFRIVIIALPFMVPQLPPPAATNCGYYGLPWQRPLLIIIIEIYTCTRAHATQRNTIINKTVPIFYRILIIIVRTHPKDLFCFYLDIRLVSINRHDTIYISITITIIIVSCIGQLEANVIIGVLQRIRFEISSKI